MTQMTVLPLDLTGGRSSHRRVDEPHSLVVIPNKPHRLLIPQFGAFYLHDLVLRRPNGQALVAGTDYVATYLHPELTELTGRSVYGLIVVLNPEVEAQLRLTYRAVGGPHALSVEELEDLMETLQDETRPVPWEKVKNRPRYIQPDEHHHEFWQLYALTPVNDGLKRLAKAIQTGDEAVMNVEREYGAEYLAEARTDLDEQLEEIETHLSDENNPHQTTKAHVQLDKLSNWPMASPEEALNPNVANRYGSIQTVSDALDVNALPSLKAHELDFNNPHGVTLTDLDMYSVSQLESIANSLLDLGAEAADTEAVNGTTYNTIIERVKTNLRASDVARSGLFAAARIGPGTANSSTVLTSEGWTSITDLIRQFQNTGTEILYIGTYPYQDRDTALAYLRNTFPPGNYATGTIAIMRSSNTYHAQIGYDGKGVIRTYYQIDVAAVYRYLSGSRDWRFPSI